MPSRSLKIRVPIHPHQSVLQVHRGYRVRTERNQALPLALHDQHIVRAGLEDPLESLLGQESLSRLGAVMAVDSNGVLRGIVTVDAVRRALRTAVTV